MSRLPSIFWFVMGLAAGLLIPKLFGEALRIHVVHEFKLPVKQLKP